MAKGAEHQCCSDSGCEPAVIDINKNLVVFLADRASFLAGGGDMVLVASDVMLLRVGGFIFAIFCSSVL